MYSIGIPKDSILTYETALKANKFLLIAHGSPDEVSKARRILEGSNETVTHLHMQEELAGARA